MSLSWRILLITTFVCLALVAGRYFTMPHTHYTPPPATAPYHIVLLGDSLAEGVGASDAAHGLGPDLLTQITAHYPNATLVNLGVSGATALDVISLQLPKVAENNPNLVVLVVGTNDILHQTSDRDFTAAWDTLVEKLPSDAQIIVASIPHFSQTPAVPEVLRGLADQRTQQFNEIIRSHAQKMGAALFDFYALSDQKLQPGSDLLSDDQFHPNDAGYAELAAAIAQLVQK